MRHRREMFSGRRDFYGSDRRDGRSDYRERNRSREQSSYRDRYERDSSNNSHKSRYNNDTVKQPERSSAFDHINRGQRDRLENFTSGTITETSSVSSKAYPNSMYGDTSVNNCVQNINGNTNASKRTWSESWKSPLMLNRSSERQRVIQDFQRSVRFHGNAAVRPEPLECTTGEAQSYLDLRRPKEDAPIRLIINGTHAGQLQHSTSITGPEHAPGQVEQNFMKVRPIGVFKREDIHHVYRHTINPPPHTVSCLQDHDERQRQDFKNPSRFEPVAVLSPGGKSMYGGESRIKTNLFGTQHPVIHQTFQPVNPALYTQNGQPVLRRGMPPCPSGLGPVAPSNEAVHKYERDHVSNGPKMFSNTRMDTQWRFPGMPPLNAAEEPFKPVCVKEAVNFLTQIDNEPNSGFIPQSSILLARDEGLHHAHIENVPRPQIYGGMTGLSSHYAMGANVLAPKAENEITRSVSQYTVHTNASTPRGHCGAVDVALIPLPLQPPPPPPPPPPAPSQQLSLPEQAQVQPNLSVSTAPPPTPLSGVEKTSQKPFKSDPISDTDKLSEDQVSSTSMDLEQVSSSVENAPKYPDTFEKSDLLRESFHKQNCKHETQIEKERQLGAARDLKQHDHLEEKCNDSEAKDSGQSSNRLSVARYVKLLYQDDTNICDQAFNAKCDENKRDDNIDRIQNTAESNDVFTNMNVNGNKKEPVSVSYKSDNGTRHQTFVTLRSVQGPKGDIAANRGCDQISDDAYQRPDMHFTRNFKNPLRNDEFLHRPWERDHWRYRPVKNGENDFNHGYKAKDQWSYKPLFRYRPYGRPYERRRLSGLGIHTYSSNLDRVGERHSHSTLGYFRPWEKPNTTLKDMNLRKDRTFEISQFPRSSFNANQFTDEDFWHDDFTFDGKERQHRTSNVGLGNIPQNNVGKSWNECEKDWQSNSFMDKGATDFNSNQYDREVKTLPPQIIQKSMFEVFQEKQKKRDSDKVCDNFVKEKEFGNEIDNQKKIDCEESVSIPNVKGRDISSEKSNDRFARKRQDKYNHGHSYSEIMAVKGKTDQNKKVRERISSQSETSHVNKPVKAGSNETNTDKISQKTIRNKVSLKVFNTSKPLKNATDSAVNTPSVVLGLNDISKLSFSKVAKPDISLENKLLKPMANGHKANSSGLDMYKIPHLRRNEEDSRKTNSKIKVKSSKKNLREKEKMAEQLSKRSDTKRITSEKECIRRGIKKLHDKRKYKDVSEKTGKKSKCVVGNEKQNKVELKSLHPKLRHKFGPPRSHLEKKKLEVVMKKCDFENTLDKCKKDSLDKGKTTSLKCKFTRRDDKKVENDPERLKQNCSLLTRGKYVLSTPNTLEVKEIKKSKVKDFFEKRKCDGKPLEEKGTLDKGLFSAKKHLLYRALAVDALKRDKTKPLVEKKYGARKSLITTDLAKQELKILKETLNTDTDKLPDHQDENSNSMVKNEKVDASKASAINLDIPTTIYQPQRTAIGNYATQCLFGPIVSSTFYKAQGNARVIRNSKETFTGYKRCPENFGMNDAICVQPFTDCDGTESSSSGTLKIDGTVSSAETKNSPMIRKSPFIDVLAGCNVSPCVTTNLVEGPGSLKEADKVTDASGKEKLLPMVTEKLFYEREGFQNNNRVHVPEFATKAESQTLTSVYDDQKRLPKVYETELLKSMALCDNSFPHPQKDVLSIPDQFEMHKKYLQCKQELAESFCSDSDSKADGASDFPPILPALSKDNFNPDHKHIYTDVKVVNAAVDENTTVYAVNQLEPKSNIDQNTAGSFSTDMQYEPSNEEFEMYRDYQIQRTMAYAEEEGKEDYFPICPEWKPDTEKHAVVGSPLAGDISGNATVPKSDTYDGVSFEENDPSVQYGEEENHFKQEPSCDIINMDQELESTSKDMFEDIVSDILKDEELISSIPINPPDITKEITYSFTNVVNEKFSDVQLADGNMVENTSQIPLLSPKFSQQEEANKENVEQARDEKECINVFKSARTPIHFGTCRKPRFEKRFPKPLPRTKPQKTVERELYEAAERFLGDFDHSHKRSRSKEKCELLINPVTGKMETVKMDTHKKEEPAMNNVKSETVQILGNSIVEPKDKFLTDNQNDADHSKTGKAPADLKRSLDSNVVTRQQVAMKKLILRPKYEKLIPRSKIENRNSKGRHGKGNTLSKGSNLLKSSVMPKKGIPCIRLKNVKEPGAKEKNTTEKWQKVTTKSKGKREKVKSNAEDANRLNSKSCKQSENKASKPTGPAETLKETDVQSKIKVWMIQQSCKLCTYSCDSNIIMMLHYSQKHPLWCYRCEKKFKDKDACQYHINQSHNAEVSCELCGTTFHHKGNYDRHLKSMYHQENKKRAESIMKEELDKKKKTEVTEAVVISDDEESCVEIVDLSNDCYKTSGTDDNDSEVDRPKHHKTKTLKSPKVNSYMQNKRKREQNDSEVTETSESEADLKKSNCLQYCNACRQYYKKICAHFKTGKHRDMVEQRQKEGRTNDSSQEVMHTLTISDTDHDTPVQTDDDTSNEDDIETIESMSPSSCRSVVIVSDHDSHCSFMDDSNALDGIGEEDAMCNKSGVRVEHPYETNSQVFDTELNTVDDGNQEKPEEFSSLQHCGNKVEEKNVNVKTETRIMPVVVSTCQEICSPTLLVKNIAADLMCKKEVKDSRQNIFESLSSAQKYCKESSPKCRKYENDRRADNQCNIKLEKDTFTKSSVKKENGSFKKHSNRNIFDTDTEHCKEKVAIVEMNPDKEELEAVDKESEETGESDAADVTDYQVTENPWSSDEAEVLDMKEDSTV